MEANSSRWVLRDYAPDDDLQCQALERHASQAQPQSRIGRWLSRTLFQAHFYHAKSFDAKARQFPRSYVLVCEDTAAASREVVGVLMVGVKDVSLRGRTVAVGYMFDLRVHERVQRHGIGSALCRLAEERCRADGVAAIYLTVNEPNAKARALYRRLGYTQASRRAPVMDFLFSRRRVWPSKDGEPSPGVSIRPVGASAAAAALSEACGGSDCAPDAAGMAGLVAHPAFEGGWEASAPDGSRARLFLWDSSTLGGFQVSRLIIPVSWIGTLSFKVVLLAALAAAGAAHARGVVTRIAAGETGAACVRGLVGVTVGWLGWQAAPYASFMKRILLNSLHHGAKVRARLFGPSCSGDLGMPLLSALVNHVGNEAHSRGYQVLVTNLDEADPRRRLFSSPKFFTLFLQKDLRADASSAPPPCFAAQAFHDPRDIS